MVFRTDNMPSTRTTKKYKPLSMKHRKAILRMIYVACEISEADESMKSTSKCLIKFACWRWTADAVDPKNGKIKRDAIKYDQQYLPHTPKAAIYLSKPVPKKHLTHEHIVPLKCLTEQILELGSTKRVAIHKLMTDYCRAALVTRKENKVLNKKGYKQKMPDGWRWRDSPFARYRKCGIRLQY